MEVRNIVLSEVILNKYLPNEYNHIFTAAKAKAVEKGEKIYFTFLKSDVLESRINLDEHHNNRILSLRFGLIEPLLVRLESVSEDSEDTSVKLGVLVLG